MPRTLEVLETLGVPVIAYRQDTLPAFWSATSELQAPLRMDSAAEIARAHRVRAGLGIPGGQLVANPVPRADEIAQSEMRPVIAQAGLDAEEIGVTGKALTPFLLRRIHDLTGGRALQANIALHAQQCPAGGRDRGRAGRHRSWHLSRRRRALIVG